MNFSELPRDAQTKMRRRNPHLFAPAPVVGPRPAQSAERDRGSNGQAGGMEAPASGVVFRISLLQCRRKLLDGHDSMPFSLKPTVDCVTAFLGFRSDDDPRLLWEFGQTLTKGAEGVLVKIQPVNL